MVMDRIVTTRLFGRMNIIGKCIAIVLANGALSGCAMFMLENQGGPWIGKHEDCPTIYQMTRIEVASLRWAIFDGKTPKDPCLARYYKKARKDDAYMTGNRYMSPFYVLSLPVDLTLDTVALPFTTSRALSQ